MNELRLPIMRIYDTDFYLDRDRRELRQVDNDSNTISFADIKERGDHDLIYDPRTKNAFKGELEDMIDRNDLVLVRLPTVLRADIDRLMNRAPVNEISPRGSESVDNLRDATHRRKRGRAI